jgi:hypothetical protein
MRKTFFVGLAIVAILFSVSCKSAPPVEEEPPVVEETVTTQFENAYEAVLPIIYDGAQNYTVLKNDKLTAIARKFYGGENPFFFPLIMAASKEKNTVDIVDPDLIDEGMELVIPDLQKNLADPGVKARIKTLLESVTAIYEGKPEAPWSEELKEGLRSTAAKL